MQPSGGHILWMALSIISRVQSLPQRCFRSNIWRALDTLHLKAMQCSSAAFLTLAVITLCFNVSFLLTSFPFLLMCAMLKMHPIRFACPCRSNTIYFLVISFHHWTGLLHKPSVTTAKPGSRKRKHTHTHARTTTTHIISIYCSEHYTFISP